MQFLSGNIKKSKQSSICIVHVAKTAGNYVKIALNDQSNTDHRTPTRRWSKDIYEKNVSIMVMRDPIERLRSAYFYHMSDSYNGALLYKIPNFKSLDLMTYALSICQFGDHFRHQYDYLLHVNAAKYVDYVVDFNRLDEGLSEFFSIIGMEYTATNAVNTTDKVERSIETDIIRMFIPPIEFKLYECIKNGGALTRGQDLMIKINR